MGTGSNPGQDCVISYIQNCNTAFGFKIIVQCRIIRGNWFLFSRRGSFTVQLALSPLSSRGLATRGIDQFLCRKLSDFLKNSLSTFVYHKLNEHVCLKKNGVVDYFFYWGLGCSTFQRNSLKPPQDQ